MSLTLGQPAPDFTLYNTTKTEVRLSHQKGKNVVLLFFPLAFTSTCTAELCSVRDDLATYKGLDAVVFGISNDSVFTLSKFKEEQRLNFDLLSDFNKTVSSTYDSLYPEFILGMKGVSKRAAFVIDKNGILQYMEILEKAGDLPNFNAIKDCLQSIQ